MRIEILNDMPRQSSARRLIDAIWPGEGTQITPNLLQAMVHNGAYLSGAIIGDDCVGVAFAFPATDSDGHLHLHSHMAGVSEHHRDKQIGLALKLHQRSWAREHGYDLITWTFDPLVSRNAHLNLNKLGVEVPKYYRNFYGEMPDEVNAGDVSDRVMAFWHLGSDRVMRALESTPPMKSNAPALITLVDNHPHLNEIAGSTLRVQLPEDIVLLRGQDLELAKQWRQVVRGALENRLAQGWKITGFTKDRCYVLEAPSED